MKIYSAFRSNHLQNSRLVKVFEADSILEVFQGFAALIRQESLHVDQETDHLTERYFGADIYGSYGWIEAIRDGLEFNTLTDLHISLQEHWYSNEIEAEDGLMQIYTDDDEIDLAWYLFDESYASRHPEKTILYTKYAESLPLQAEGEGPFEPECELLDITPAGNGEGKLYMVMVAVYDSSVLTGMAGSAQIKGVRLPGLAEWLRGSKPACKDWGYDAQIRYLSSIAKAMPEADLGKILQAFAFKPLSDLSQRSRLSELVQKEWSEIQTLPTRNNTDRTAVQMGEHIAELQINASSFEHDDYYDYCILFDDIWAGAHPHLARNLLRFGAGDKL